MHLLFSLLSVICLVTRKIANNTKSGFCAIGGSCYVLGYGSWIPYDVKY